MAKVLLVDDEQALVLALTCNLQEEGYNVLSAINGPDALEIARSKQPDIVVLDVMLPGLSGR